MKPWDAILDRMLRHLIRVGALELTYHDGTIRRYGDGTGEPVKVTIQSPDTVKKIVVNPELGVGEGYMRGDYTIDADDLRGFLALTIRNQTGAGMPWFEKPREASRFLGRRFAQFNPVNKARTNVAHHYDLSGELYDLFLDADRQYSCAYFEHPDMTLDQAQEAKKRHIAKKLLLKPGMRVLDIGCGWGGMAITLARDYGVDIVGVTLSTQQHALATKRVRDAGLEDKIDIRLTDYRDVRETFDRIVSVGMFEHVGVPHYREYFRHVREMLRPGGVSLIHFIGRSGPGGATADFITKYIFPGGYCPAMSEASHALEHEGLIVTDLEVWRLHYAETLKHWCARFEANLDKAAALYDEEFTRMWRFYLIASEMAFRHGGQVVFQFQLAHEVGDVPLTRDYLYRDDAEGQGRAQDQQMAAE